MNVSSLKYIFLTLIEHNNVKGEGAPKLLNLTMLNIFRGQTALHKAAAARQRSICCMLVAGGAAIGMQDHQGVTARELALRAEDAELAAYLESKSPPYYLRANLSLLLIIIEKSSGCA
jgi:hypothetical protein